MKLYIILIVIGAVFIVSGVVVYLINKDGASAGKSIECNDVKQPDAKGVGNMFEDFVANLFKNSNIFVVKEWNKGSTSSEGVYAEQDKKPDFKICQNFNGRELVYWIECKYRSKTSDKGFIKIDDYQLSRYRKIQKDSRKKVLIAIGIGGEPTQPKDFFVVPLDSINKEYIHIDNIKRYELLKPAEEFAGYIDSYFMEKVFPKSKKSKE